ncbi:hypothetical protein HMPREF9374_2844 [Desmospora sp. 8437]|nr:hypothetical protein HMPREF9374_2844 [Desmospora sp. 8437]
MSATFHIIAVQNQHSLLYGNSRPIARKNRDLPRFFRPSLPLSAKIRPDQV